MEKAFFFFLGDFLEEQYMTFVCLLKNRKLHERQRAFYDKRLFHNIDYDIDYFKSFDQIKTYRDT